MHDTTGMRQSPYRRLRHSTAGDRDASPQRPRRPVWTRVGVHGGLTVEVKTDSTGLPGKRVVVVVERIPAGVEDGVIAAGGRRRMSELRVIIIFKNRHPDLLQLLCGTI